MNAYRCIIYSIQIYVTATRNSAREHAASVRGHHTPSTHIVGDGEGGGEVGWGPVGCSEVRVRYRRF